MNKSTSFLLPTMKFSNLILSSYTTTYIGHERYESIDVWGNYLYLQITSELVDCILLDELRSHPQYKTEIDEKDFVFFVFQFTPVQKMTIVIPFMMGKYSEIDRTYVTENFPMVIKGKVSMNWRILNKDIWQMPKEVVPLTQYWRGRMGQKVPDNYDVWPKPKMEDEIYDYYNGVVKRELEQTEALTH